jgi:hypothetical protein
MAVLQEKLVGENFCGKVPMEKFLSESCKKTKCRINTPSFGDLYTPNPSHHKRILIKFGQVNGSGSKSTHCVQYCIVRTIL